MYLTILVLRIVLIDVKEKINIPSTLYVDNRYKIYVYVIDFN